MGETHSDSEEPRILGSEYISRLPTRRLSQIAMDRRDCVICHEQHTEDSESRIVQVDCCHSTYHDHCILEWLGEEGAAQDNCPYCRKQLFKTFANDEGRRFTPAYRYNPQGEFWLNSDDIRVDDEEVSNHIQRVNDEDMEDARAGFLEEDGEIGNFEPDDPPYVYFEGQWYDGFGAEIFPHQVHDGLTGGWDHLEDQRTTPQIDNLVIEE